MYIIPRKLNLLLVQAVFLHFFHKKTCPNPSNHFSAFYSTVKTYEFSAISNLFFYKNKMASSIDIRYGNKVDRFYGVGNNTPDLGTEEYVLENMGGIIDFQVPSAIVISDRLGLVLEYRKYSLIDIKENPDLEDILFREVREVCLRVRHCMGLGHPGSCFFPKYWWYNEGQNSFLYPGSGE